MKKIVLALIAMLAGAAFAPVATALPLFARQTGFACTQCHFQHFPLLNAFGRSFKAGGYTMMGAQPKVEGEGLSIPNTLNFGVLTTMGAEKVSQDDPTVASQDSFNTPAGGGELSLFYGGRVSDNVGFLSELGAAGTAKTSSAKMPIFYEVAEGTRAGVVFLTTAGQGAAHSFETLNTGAVAVHRMAPMAGQATKAHIGVNSAAQYLGTATAAQGASFVVNNDNYFVNVGKYKTSAADTALGTSTKGGAMRMTYMRAAAMFEVAGFDSAVGVQAFRGDDGAATPKGAEATIIDAQMQGKLGERALGVYFSYGTAPSINTADVTGNYFNSHTALTAHTASTKTASSMNIAAELGIIPGVSTVMAAMRLGKNGNEVTTTGEAVTDNGVMIGVTYELAMNVEASLSYTAQSGTAWDVDVGGTGYLPAGKTVTTLMLEALF